MFNEVPGPFFGLLVSESNNYSQLIISGFSIYFGHAMFMS